LALPPDSLLQLLQVDHDTPRRAVVAQPAGGRQIAQAAGAAAYRCVEAALQDAERRGDAAGVVARLSVRGFLATCMGEGERGQADCARAVTLSRSLDAAPTLTRALLNLGRHHLYSGGWDEAGRPLHEALTLAERSRDVNLMRWAHSLLAEGELRAGAPAAARHASPRWWPRLIRASRT
jgi:hypothetical protein